MSTRRARASWEGSLREGSGKISLESGACESAYSFGSRFEAGRGTNPEELLAAAHAGCFAMALSLGDLSAVAIFGAEGFATLPWLLFSRMASYRTADAAGIALILGVICLLLTLPSTAAERTTESRSADA